MNVKLIGILLSCLALLGTVFYIYTLRAKNKALKVENTALVEKLEVATLEINQCVSDKNLSEKASHDYQASVRSLRRQLDSLRNDPRCVSIKPASPPNGHNGAATGTEFSGRDSLRLGYIVDFGGRCEETRLKLLGCQKFIDDLYASRGKR